MDAFSRKPASAHVTGLLARLRDGDGAAFDELFPLVYRRLHELAHVQRTRWGGDHTLNTTALVHEAYLKLVGRESARWNDRSHFLAVASRAMRQILIDYARGRQAAKRGKGLKPLSLDEMRGALEATPGFTEERVDALVALDVSLERLEEQNPRPRRSCDDLEHRGAEAPVSRRGAWVTGERHGQRNP